jgi:hypothetical protein
MTEVTMPEAVRHVDFRQHVAEDDFDRALNWLVR